MQIPIYTLRNCNPGKYQLQPVARVYHLVKRKRVPEMDQADIGQLFSVLESNADSEAAKQMSAYMRDQFSFLGIATPNRRNSVRIFCAMQGKKK
jgi:hypothetical protein